MIQIIEPELKKLSYFELEDELTQLTVIQQFFAETYTFENLDVLLKNDQPINEDFLIDKLLIKKRGGLCYELNGTLYLVLQALGFDVTLGVATVWSEDGWIIDKTHTIILFYKDNHMYLLDSGSGSNLAIQPLQLDGDAVQSRAGKFRLRTKATERGTVVLEKFTKKGWALTYAFYPKPVEFNDINRIKKMIHEHPESPFNKTLLIAKTVNDGTVSITKERLNRKCINEKGLEEKNVRIPFQNKEEMLQQIKKHSSLSTYEAAKLYTNML